jgi:ABC-type uncharacterized transport system permease subunit
MQELQVSWARIFSVWWLLVWRTALGGLVLGFGVGFLIGLVGAFFGVPGEASTVLAGVLGWVVSLGWGVIVVRMSLKKQYREFRLAVVPRAAS